MVVEQLARSRRCKGYRHPAYTKEVKAEQQTDSCARTITCKYQEGQRIKEKKSVAAFAVIQSDHKYSKRKENKTEQKHK